jgi:hypothetical protein
VIYDAVIRQGYGAKHTRYLITDKRVLIQRGYEELHVDRGIIVDVIGAPWAMACTTCSFVLDGRGPERWPERRVRRVSVVVRTCARVRSSG